MSSERNYQVYVTDMHGNGLNGCKITPTVAGGCNRTGGDGSYRCLCFLEPNVVEIGFSVSHPGYETVVFGIPISQTFVSIQLVPTHAPHKVE